MTGHMIKIEMPEGELESIMSELTAAQQTVYKCYNRLIDLGVVTIKETPSAATDGEAQSSDSDDFASLMEKFAHDRDNQKYSFTKERIERANTHISERRKKTLRHFGYTEPKGEVHATFHNKSPFLNVAEIIQTLPIDEGRKTRIIFDYDPDFAHCLLQINQSDELCSH